MKGQGKTASKALAVLFAAASLAFGQNSSSLSPRTVAAAGPGSVNYVEGTASLNGAPLSAQSVGSITLKPGEILNTDSGYTEVLLTPGAFLRVGPNSSIRLATAGLADSQVDLLRGSSFIEVDQLIKGTNLSVSSNGADTRFEKTGLYAFDTTQQSVRVLDGKAKVTFDDHTETLGKHDEVLLASDRPLKKRSFNENSAKAEPLYVWSRARSEDESQASYQAASNAPSYSAAGPGWFWNPYYLSYGFWPAGGPLFSPFGWGFYSPAYFGFYRGGFYPGYFGRPGFYGYGHPVWRGRVGGINARVGGFHSAGGFHGGAIGRGFHGGAIGGGFHGGGFGGHR